MVLLEKLRERIDHWFDRKEPVDYEFLPPALEIEETPTSPLQRGMIWFISILFTIAVIWSIVGTVDEVAVARGKIIPDGRVKVIQPVEEGVIRAIHVEEGQKVAVGQLLIELDTTIKEADAESTKKNLALLEGERAILLAEMTGSEVDAGEAPEALDAEGIRALEIQKQTKEARENEYRTKRQALMDTIRQKESELESAQRILPHLEETVRLIEEEEQVYKTLYENGAIAKMDWVQKQKELATARQRWEEQRDVVVKTANLLAEAKNNLGIFEMERLRTISEELKEKEKAIASLEGEAVKAQKRLDMERLISPVAGTVHGLASYTVGGVVTPAQPVVTIVPEGTPLIVEASALNKDIGFLEVGQEVEVKLETFPFQKYGTVKGWVESISPDAVEDEKQGLVYKVKVRLEKNTLEVNGREVPLAPGMAVDAEVKTGKRRIIEFFLSPIIKYAKESLTLR